MRTLNLNKTVLWKVEPTGFTDEIDIDGNFTGVTLPTFGEPTKIKVALYPVTGKIKRDFLGIFVDEDYVISSTDVTLSKDTLLFKSEPIDDFDINYDYIVVNELKSLNSTLYTIKSAI